MRFRSLEVSDPRFEHEHLRHATVRSAALGGRADVTLFVPPGTAGMADLPVLILLHGVYGSHWAWALNGGAHRSALRLMEAGRIEPLVLAMPSDGLWGDGSGYVAHRRQDCERWIVEEVPALVNAVVPQTGARSPLCIGGLSMGGFGALRLGAKYRERFSAICAHSALTHWDQLRYFVADDLSEVALADDERDLFALLAGRRDGLPPLRFDCGTSDPLLAANRVLHEALLDAGVPHRFDEFPGGHDWAYWSEHIGDSLLFCSQAVQKRP